MPSRRIDDTVEFVPPMDLGVDFHTPSYPEVHVEFGALSHCGNVRKNNEDQYIIVKRRRTRSIIASSLPPAQHPASADDAYVLVVADGMGGQAFGELASTMALRAGWELGGHEVSWPGKVTAEEVGELMGKLEGYPLSVQEEIVAQAKEQPLLNGMGTTFTAAYTIGREAFVTHVGDSRAYLFREDRLMRLTKDHTQAQELLDAGLPEDHDRVQHGKHVLTNCLGAHEDEVHVETNHCLLDDQDRLLLCSDGLTDCVGDAEIADLLSRKMEPQASSQALVDLALERGGRDNVTVVIAAYAMPASGQKPAPSGADDTHNE